jgi:pimeloyl-ACP methyl ester carboxylesterase
VIALLSVLVAVEVVLPVLLWLARDRLLFFPDPDPPATAGLPRFGPAVEARVVEVVRPDGRRLQSYDARPAGAGDGGPVVLFLHGNAGNLARRAGILGEFVRGTGCRVLAPDWSGFGGNGGSPSEDEVVADALAALDHLRAEGVPGERVVLYGECIGGAVALAVAAERPCAGVVAQSSFSSLSSMALRVYPVLPLAALLARGSFPSAERARRLRVPLLVAHGTRDSVVPPAEGRALHEAAGARGEWLPVEGADHNDFFDTAGGDYLRGLGERFRRWAGPR